MFLEMIFRVDRFRKFMREEIIMTLRIVATALTLGIVEVAQVVRRAVWISTVMIKTLNHAAADAILKIIKRRTDRVAAVVLMILTNS